MMRIRFAFPAFLLISFAVFFPALRGAFIMDDWGYITQNPQITDTRSPLHFWVSFRTGPDFWPLSYTFYWLFYRLFGTNPVGYHVVNIVMHAVNGVLVLLLAYRFAPRKAPWAALLFLVHPMQVQAVAWIIQFKTLLSTQLALITVLLYLRNLQDHRVVALFTFGLSLLAKTSTMFLPFAIAFLEWHKDTWRHRLERLSPFFALGVLGGVATLWSNYLNFNEFDTPVFHMAWYQRPLLMAQNLAFYLGTFFVPHKLSFLYPYVVPNIYAWFVGLLAIVTAVVGVVMTQVKWLSGTRRHFLAYLMAIFPCLGLIAIPNMKLSLVADHWAYWPNVFLVIAVAVVLEKIRWPKLAHLAAVLVIIALGIRANLHAQIFESEEEFWAHALKMNPDSAIPHYNLGTALDKQGRLQDAFNEYSAAVRIDPLHARAFYNLGRVQYLMGNLAGARESFRTTIKLNPKINAAYISLSKIHVVLLEKDKAIEIARQGLQANPDDPELVKWVAQLQSQDP
jgi:tetratricopeptide (TPR) repeat protein